MVTVSIFFRSLGFHIYFILMSIYLVLVSIPRVIKDSNYTHIFYKRWGYLTIWGLKHICKIDLAIRGADYIPSDGKSALFACKHQSTLETILLFIILDRPAVVLKKELEKLPFAKFFIKGARHIPIDRKAGSKMRDLLVKEAEKRYQTKQSILIYPEGTRSEVNSAPRYKRGIFAIYDYLKVECVPIALNSGLFWPKKGFFFYPGTVIIEFLPPIETNLSENQFMTELTTRVESTVARLVQEGVAEQTAIRRKTHPKYKER